MPNLVNEAIATEYEQLLAEGLDALFVQPVGMSVEQANAFRGRLAASNLGMRLLKGSLARRALEARGLQVDGLFDGPAAVIVARGEVETPAIAASRVVAAWRKETGTELPAVKGGIMEGEILRGRAAEDLAKLPTKADLQARLLGQILAPGRRLSSQLRAGGSRIAGAIKSHIEKLESSG